MSEHLRALKGMVWDLDNTLYRTEEALDQAINVAMARSVIAAGVPLTLDEATKLSRQSFRETGYSGRYFIQTYNLDPRKLHFESHHLIDEKIIERSIEVSKMFGEVGVDHALVTHGARDWAMRVLLHLDLLHWFPHERIHGFEDYDFERKSDSTRPFEQALESLALDPKDTLIVEDTIENLRIPRDMGMGTVFLSHGRKVADMPDYVDIVCNNAADILGMVRQAKTVS